MLAMGFSLNTVSFCALVLAIGIVVDDAIVVVEAVEAKMHENPGMSAADAARAAMGEITGAIVAITLVLLSVSCRSPSFRGYRACCSSSSPSRFRCRWSFRPSTP